MDSSNGRRWRGDGAHQGFDFTRGIRLLCGDMAERVGALRHIDMQRVAVSFCQTRKPTPHGVFATLTPLRFAGGGTETVRRGRRWTIQRVRDSQGREMLYLLSFYLPRFLDLPFREKLVTVVHELWHIGPRFDGDVRRFDGRCYAHSGSKQQYDAEAAAMVDAYLAGAPPRCLFGFLEKSFRELIEEHGSVYGVKVPAPKLVPLD